MKKIIVDGSEIEVLDYKWENEFLKQFVNWKLEILPITIDYIKIKIGRHQNCKELLKKLSANEYMIEADNKKAKFYLGVEEMQRLFTWYKQSESDEIEIHFIGTCNDVD